jgi:hypothetical protein
MKINKKIFYIIISIISITIIITVGMYSFKSDKVAAIDNKVITKSELSKFLLKKYAKDALAQLVDDDLINIEVGKNNINVSDDEIKHESNLMKEYRDNKYDISDNENLEYVKERVLAKKLISKNLSKDKITLFYQNNKLSNPDTYSANVYTFDNNEKAMNAEENINSKKIKVEDLVNISISKENRIFSATDNPFMLNLDNITEGKASHFHDMNNNKHLVVIIDKIIKGSQLDFTKDYNIIVDIYLQQYYSTEKINLINKLKSKYIVSMNDSF